MSITREFYDSGALKSKGITENGLKEGKWITYSEEGKLLTEDHFNKGLQDGNFKRWHANGNIAIETFHVNGKNEGYWKEYYENGKIKEIGEYRIGEYFPIDFWNEEGVQLLKNGTGKKIEIFGYLELDIYEHFFENGKFLKEVKISSARYGGFFPNEGST